MKLKDNLMLSFKIELIRLKLFKLFKFILFYIVYGNLTDEKDNIVFFDIFNIKYC